MSGGKIITYWVPLILGVAFAILGAILPKYIESLPSWFRYAAIILALLLVVLSGALAYWGMGSELPRGGRGGSAKVSGDDNEAVGGRGGDAGQGDGGDGGKAVARGNRSVAKGGAGGKGA